MSIGARCGSCNRELLLGQLVQPSDGFRCPVCGFAFAPTYATVAPDTGAGSWSLSRPWSPRTRSLRR